ncbi:MAG: hypothetical protein Q9188_005846 [Gyalolechia gomerana]
MSGGLTFQDERDALCELALDPPHCKSSQYMPVGYQKYIARDVAVLGFADRSLMETGPDIVDQPVQPIGDICRRSGDAI